MGVLPARIGGKNKHGELKYVILCLAAVATASALSSVSLTAIVSAGALMVIVPVLLMCMVGARLPIYHPELFEAEHVKIPRI